MSKITISPAVGLIVHPIATVLIAVSVISTEENLVLRSSPAMLGLGIAAGLRNIVHFQEGKDKSVLPVWVKILLSALLLAIVVFIHLKYSPANQLVRLGLVFMQIGYGANLVSQITLWVFQSLSNLNRPVEGAKE